VKLLGSASADTRLVGGKEMHQVGEELNERTATQAVLERQIITYKKDIYRMHFRNNSGTILVWFFYESLD